MPHRASLRSMFERMRYPPTRPPPPPPPRTQTLPSSQPRPKQHPDSPSTKIPRPSQQPTQHLGMIHKLPGNNMNHLPFDLQLTTNPQ